MFPPSGKVLNCSKLYQMEEMKVKNLKLKMKISAITAISVLLLGPISASAFFMEDFFSEFEKFFSEDFDKDFMETDTSTQIINEVNVSANTGGNVAEGGEIKEGEQKINVEIKNVINGESIEPIEIETEANKVEVKSKIEIKGDDSEPIVEKEIIIDDEKKTETKETSQEETEKEAEKWFPNFVEEIKNFFLNIFKIFK